MTSEDTYPFDLETELMACAGVTNFSDTEKIDKLMTLLNLISEKAQQAISRFEIAAIYSARIRFRECAHEHQQNSVPKGPVHG